MLGGHHIPHCLNDRTKIIIKIFSAIRSRLNFTEILLQVNYSITPIAFQPNLIALSFNVLSLFSNLQKHKNYLLP